jgi:hypothetical protein
LKETKIQNDIMIVLGEHPLVAWSMTTTTGTYKISRGGGVQYVTLGFKGLSDIIGQLKDGRLLAIEVKKPKEYPREEQLDFLRNVALNNGFAFWTDSAEYVREILDIELKTN